MKTVLTVLIFSLTIFQINGQTICGVDWPPENRRPDTITAYLFTSNSILTKNVPSANTISNFSFKTTDFTITWMPVRTIDVDDFVARSLKGLKNYEILDTLSCDIFGDKKMVLVIRAKRKTMLWAYQRDVEYQDFFYIKRIKRRKLKQAITYLSTNLRE